MSRKNNEDCKEKVNIINGNGLLHFENKPKCTIFTAGIDATRILLGIK
jgi:hypothetical protein